MCIPDQRASMEAGIEDGQKVHAERKSALPVKGSNILASAQDNKIIKLVEKKSPIVTMFIQFTIKWKNKIYDFLSYILL